MGLTSSKIKNNFVGLIINLLDTNVDNYIFEKYIDIFLCLFKQQPLTFEEKNYKYVLKAKDFGVFGYTYELCATKMNGMSFCVLHNSWNTSPIIQSFEIQHEKVFVDYFIDHHIDLNSTIDALKFIRFINKKKIMYEKIIFDITHTPKKFITKYSKDNIKLTIIKDKYLKNYSKYGIEFDLRDLEEIVKKLNQLEKKFPIIAEAVKIINSSAPEEENYKITEAVKIINSSAPEEENYKIAEAVTTQFQINR
uniref:Uncharacterized protein n=1 Tax=viral metagenome TaxID=1070528 RepID=A0A6C0AE12_9ZZZZ